MIIYTKTWVKDSNDLIDFDARDVSENEFSVDTRSYLFRNNFELIISDNYDVNRTKPILAIDINSNNTFKVILSDKNLLLGEDAYFVIKYFENSKFYTLTIGDIIKLGRIKIRLINYKLDEKDITILDNNLGENLDKDSNWSHELVRKKRYSSENLNLNLVNKNPKHRNSDRKVCRICYCDDIEVESPLLTPCICSGSMRYIHLTCLQKWLKSKILKLNDESSELVTCYQVKNTECELCKTPFPDIVQYQRKKYEIFDFLKPDECKSYAFFEYYEEATRYLYSINLTKNKSLLMGRSNDCDFKLNDISISRLHCYLHKSSDGTLMIEDRHSKFGTLIKLQMESFTIIESHVLPLQVGKSFLEFRVQIPWYRCLCLKESEKKIRNEDYQKLNSASIVAIKEQVVKIQDEDLVSKNQSPFVKKELRTIGEDLLGSFENRLLNENPEISDNKSVQSRFKDKGSGVTKKISHNKVIIKEVQNKNDKIDVKVNKPVSCLEDLENIE